MELSKSQSIAFDKARARGSGDQGVSLADSAVRALVALVARDLGLSGVAPLGSLAGREYYDIPVGEVTLAGSESARSAYCSLLQEGPADTDLYFLSLAALHRARLKFANIMKLQVTPSLEQVGPRGLLQYGDLTAGMLGSFLIVRKWFYDIDNRSAQETGYLFEPVVAGAVGGFPVSASSSPVKRRGTGSGRQVDCLLDDDAYEIKIRVTDAASGQGRWSEELTFPGDCRASGYNPVLVVFDGTNNPKLSQLCNEFTSHGGAAYVGQAAWTHLTSLAGDVMGTFIEKYIRSPLDELLAKTPAVLPPVTLQLHPNSIQLSVGTEERSVSRE